jgi:uncharacterized protein
VANKWDERKKAKEDEYFVKQERELLAKMKAKQEAEAKEEAAKKAASMLCPKCGEPLKERSFQKILIDQCVGCNGIWLDAGELDQLAEKENSGWLGKFWQKNG